MEMRWNRSRCTVLVWCALVFLAIRIFLYPNTSLKSAWGTPSPSLTAVSAVHTTSPVLFSSFGSTASRWVIIISSSFDWQSYRHMSDALSFFCLARSLGVDTRHIILLLSHPLLACDGRNPHPGRILSSNNQHLCSKKKHSVAESDSPFFPSEEENENLWTAAALSQIDYCGAAVNVRTVLSLLQGGSSGGLNSASAWGQGDGGVTPFFRRSAVAKSHKLDDQQERDNYFLNNKHIMSASFSKRKSSFESYFKTLQSDMHSDVVIYLSGHGYPLYFKFNEVEFLSARQLARGVDDMYQKGRFRRLLILLDTCQAISMCDGIYTPNVVCIGSSSDKAFSYASAVDPRLMSNFFTSSDWMGNIIQALRKSQCHSSTLSPSVPSPLKRTDLDDRNSFRRVTRRMVKEKDFLFEPLTSFASLLLPRDPYPFKAQRSFGVINGLLEWSLGDFLCPVNETSFEEKKLFHSSLNVENIPIVSMDSFLHL